uniref:Uncharacterized protein n=1 Tax=Nelumbo nucifera TaxID=4432 RepID=A0A822YVK2_NELNU|nr:TPA_asm: hypothetical protein HUJ06_007228 [Nelumbo nucifera]
MCYNRRTRTVFDIAVKVHRNIQERDIEVGRNLGNWILRWLDRNKPSANIRGGPPGLPAGGNFAKQMTSIPIRETYGSRGGGRHGQINGRVFASSMNLRRKSFPTLGTIMLPVKPAATNVQYRHLCINGPEMQRMRCGRGRFEGVIRKDIMQWMQQS